MDTRMKYKPYTAYKDSEIEWLGEVPEHWKVCELKRLLVAPLMYGANEASNDDTPDNPRFVRITDIDSNGNLREDTFRSLPREVVEPYLLTEGDVLLARSGATVGKSFIYRTSWGVCCFAGYLIKARPNRDLIDPDYLYACCQSSFYWQYINSEQIQATIQNVSAERYGNFVLPLPSTEEQTFIATFLDRETAKIDTLIAEQERLIELLQEKRIVLISHAVTKGLNPDAPMKDSGVEWLGKVPTHWEVKKLKYLLRRNGLVRGPFGGDLKKEIFSDVGVKVYEQKNAIYKNYLLGDSYISELKFREMSRFLVSPGDYIMSCSGTIGKTFRIPEDAPIGIINQALLIIRFNELIDNNYADWIFIADFFQLQILDNSQGGAMKNLVGMDVFTSIGLPIPPIDEQSAIAAFLNRETVKIDNLIAKSRQAIDLLKERRTALISAAVTGKIDVRDTIN